ncbi:hypothetical protein [Algoriphagus boritolerans]|uniref:hypothetical protein n=1 Tax=Algoriphagus boritolerans TaxID=308111 RepID=UPI000ABD62E8
MLFFSENLREKFKNSAFSLQPSDLKFQLSHFSFLTSKFNVLTFSLLLTLYFPLFTSKSKAQSLDDYLIVAAQNNPGLKAPTPAMLHPRNELGKFHSLILS